MGRRNRAKAPHVVGRRRHALPEEILYPGGRAAHKLHQNANSILFWANASTHCNDGYQIIFPQSTEFGTFHCKSSFCRWPVTSEPFNGTDEYRNGIDASWWKNHPVGNSIFAFDRKEDS